MQWEGGRSKCTCEYDRGGGSNFCYFGAYVLIEWPLKARVVLGALLCKII